MKKSKWLTASGSRRAASHATASPSPANPKPPVRPPRAPEVACRLAGIQRGSVVSNSGQGRSSAQCGRGMRDEFAHRQRGRLFVHDGDDSGFAADRAGGERRAVAKDSSTPKAAWRQGQCLAFIHYYTKLNGRPAAETDMQRHFGATPPTVHQMILTLEKRGWIERTPGAARSIRLRVPREQLPDLE